HGPWAISRLPGGKRRGRGFEGRNVRGAAAAGELMALARDAVLPPRREEPPSHLHGGCCPPAPAPIALPPLRGPGQLLPLPNRPRHDHRPWGHGNGPGREDVWAGGGTAGETPSHGGRDGRLRTAARRRDGGRRLLLRPRGLRGRGVAHR